MFRAGLFRAGRLALILLALSIGVAPERAFAQVEPAPSESAQPAEELEALIRILENPEARDAMIARLKALDRQDEPAADEVTTLADDLMAEAAKRREHVDEVIGEVVESWHQLPFFAGWLQGQFADPARRGIWLEALSHLAVIFAAAYLVWRLSRNRIARSLASHPLWPGKPWSQASGDVVLGLLPAGLFVLTATVPLIVIDQHDETRRAGIILACGIGLVLVWGTLVRAVLGEGGFARASAPEARILERGLRVTGQIAIGVQTALSAAHRLGLPWTIAGFFEHILYLGVALSLCITILRVRAWVTKMLERRVEDKPTSLTRFLPMRFIAASWHIWAILWVGVHYVVWALRVPGGFDYLSRATLATIVILVVARSLVLWIDKSFAKGVPIVAGADELLPGVEERVTFYGNPLRLILRWGVIGGMAVALLEAWETGVLGWLASDTGQKATGLVLTLAVIGVGALLASEAVGLVAGRLIGAKDAEGLPRYSNRVRTLASIVRNVTVVLIVAIAVVTGLSEVGVDATALLAGAGVVGLAIGFGSQRLVQDLINGLFILLGDTVRVGDVVEVAGKAGSVESMTMRTVALRGYDGSVHTIPYSGIDTITNMTKEFSYAVLEIGVSYGENTDEVIRVICEVEENLRREWPFRRLMLERLEVAGVDVLGDSAVVIKARSKTRPGEQWRVRRELTRRIKLRFDELGIEIPFPHRTLVMRTDDSGKPTMPVDEEKRSQPEGAH